MIDDWIGLIPAAGKGLRLGLPYPKELYPIIRDNRYKPVSQFIVDQLLNVGLKHIVFIINETKHQLIGYYGSGKRFRCSFSYVYQEPHNVPSISSSSHGLAHALDSAYHLTRNKLVFFGMPDTIIQPDSAFSSGFDYLKTGTNVVLCLFPTNSPHKFGMVRTGKDNVVLEIIDKPQETDLKFMWGCIIWDEKFTEYLHQSVADKQCSDFAKIMNNAIQDNLTFKGKIIKNGNYIDLGTYDEIMALDKQLRE